MTKAIGIQIGARTHHQDHVITPPNFKPINNRPNRLQKLIPPVDLLYFDI